MASFSSLYFSASIPWFSVYSWSFIDLYILAVVSSALPSSRGIKGNFLWSLFVFFLEQIFMSVLLFKILLLYPTVFPRPMFRKLSSI